MSTSAMKILCRYQYDPLDRLTGLKPAEHVGTQRFYQNDELVNEIEGQVELTIVRHEAQPLAQRLHIANVTETTLLATDQQRSVLQTLAGTDTQRMTYTAYGHRPAKSGLSSLLGFNGERPDPITRHYLLGQGNRAFNPVLMRFNSPDELSPFGDGGINAYAYCGGDPINRYDPSGNIGLYRFWDTLTISPPNIMRPWEQQKALDLSIPRTISRSTQTETLTPQPTLFQKYMAAAIEETSGKFTFPPTGYTKPRAPKTPTISRKQQGRNKYQKDLSTMARHYDLRIKEHGPDALTPNILERYRSRKAKLDTLKAELATLKKIKREDSKYRQTLKYAKVNVIENTYNITFRQIRSGDVHQTLEDLFSKVRRQ
ncbi:RHS repeat-associated core domain-containing protein [Pseudomonas beijingensis]|uniref:RHS repeat-associated core domain-containing protein n=1 Tax=Pseudomonas beijingensis TaxID=2954101 RepID=UPI0027373D9C|nr:RHS repeat-associated core domain-containing protein [Pseudomonas sp. FP2262]WLH44203.1 RHS repeat-associated core domain-containing protein [Pseudomonas sp. FP2262]